MPLSTDTNLQVGEAREHATRDEVGALQAVLQEHLDRRVRVGRRRCRSARCARDRTTTSSRRSRCGSGSGAAPPAAIDHSGSQCSSPRYGSPNRCGSPVKRMPRWPLSTLRSTSFTASSMSQNGMVMIVSRRRASADAQSRRKSLYAAHAHELELVVTDVEEPLAAEAGHVRIEHLRPDPHLVHVAEAGIGVVRGRVALLVGLRAGGERLGPARDRGEPGAAERRAVEHPHVAALVVALDVRHLVEVPRRDPGGPHVGWLGEVRVGVDDELRHTATVRPSGRTGIRAHPTWNSDTSRESSASTTS